MNSSSILHKLVGYSTTNKGPPPTEEPTKPTGIESALIQLLELNYSKAPVVNININVGTKEEVLSGTSEVQAKPSSLIHSETIVKEETLSGPLTSGSIPPISTASSIVSPEPTIIPSPIKTTKGTLVLETSTLQPPMFNSTSVHQGSLH